LGEFLPVVGTTGLLGLWLYQTSNIAKQLAELQRLDVAYSAFQTYQSNNALFNSLINLSEKQDTDEVVPKIRNLQFTNYEYALREIEKVLPPESLKGVPPATQYTSLAEITPRMKEIQIRLQKLQELLFERQKTIKANVDHENKTYIIWYIVLSGVAIIGAALNAIGKVVDSP